MSVTEQAPRVANAVFYPRSGVFTVCWVPVFLFSNSLEIWGF